MNATDMQETIAAFQKLSADQQARQIGHLLGTCIAPNTLQTQSLIDSIKKIMQQEAARLKDIYGQWTYPINKVQVPNNIEASVKSLVRRGDITTQAQLSAYLEKTRAPFMAGLKNGIVETTKKKGGVQKAVGVAQSREIESKIAHAAQTAQATIVASSALTIEEANAILSKSKELAVLDARVAELGKTVPNTKFGLLEKRILNANEVLLQIENAELYYSTMRTSNNDVIKIAEYTKIPADILLRIKSHIFLDQHPLREGIRRFHADVDMAKAWKRLINGNFVQSDLCLLQHEFAESLIMQGGKVDYHTAHKLVNQNKKYNWQDFLK